MENIEQKMADLKAWLDCIKDQPLEEMDAFFTARIDGYDEHMLDTWAEDYPLIAENLPEDAKEILDLGCGTGLELEAIFEKFPEIHVTGVDLSWTMLMKLILKYPDKHISMRCEDYFVAELDPESFDAAVSFESLHHFTAEKKLGLFKKVYDALKPGGKFIICDYYAWNQEHEELLMATNAELRAKWNVQDEEFMHFDTPLTPEHEMEVLQEAGFECEFSWCVDAGLIIARKG